MFLAKHLAINSVRVFTLLYLVYLIYCLKDVISKFDEMRDGLYVTISERTQKKKEKNQKQKVYRSKEVFLKTRSCVWENFK